MHAKMHIATQITSHCSGWTCLTVVQYARAQQNHLHPQQLLAAGTYCIAVRGSEPSKSQMSTTMSTTDRRSFCRAIFWPTFRAKSNSGSCASATWLLMRLQCRTKYMDYLQRAWKSLSRFDLAIGASSSHNSPIYLVVRRRP